MKNSITERSKLQFFTNDGKKLSLLDDKEEFIRTYEQLTEGQCILAFLGFLQLGEVSFVDDYRWLHIGKHSLSKFTEVKVPHKHFYFLYEVVEFLELQGTTLQQFLKMGRLDIESHVGFKEDEKLWPEYEVQEVKAYVTFHHPEHALEELLPLYKSEERVIFWKPKDKPE